IVCFVLNSVAQDRQTEPDTERIELQRIFRQELGQHDRAAISRYRAYTDLRYGHEWCAAFVSYCFGQLGRDVPKTPWSPSLFPNRRLVWHKIHQKGPSARWLPGMVWGIYIPGKKRVGHVGFVDSYQNGMVTTVEGNTSNPQATGTNGVYRKRRAWRTIYCLADWL